VVLPAGTFPLTPIAAELRDVVDPLWIRGDGRDATTLVSTDGYGLTVTDAWLLLSDLAVAGVRTAPRTGGQCLLMVGDANLGLQRVDLETCAQASVFSEG